MMKYLSVFLALLLFPCIASAQSLSEQAIVGATGTASVGAVIGAARTLSHPDDPMIKKLQGQGYMDVGPDPSIPSQYRAIDPRQGPVLIVVDPKTSQITSVKPE